MAKSFSRASTANVVEDFSRNKGYHEPSKRHFEMVLEDGKYKFRRYQLDDKDEHINVFEQEVDWILGSGKTSRNYFYQTDAGELYQLPIAYYAREKFWYMAPGYDRREHEGVMRRVGRECMFCHNAYPDVAEGSDAYGARPVYPSKLPQGIGCQRCHGPGAEHVRAALNKDTEVERVRATIVNPARLEPQLRDAVCDQCHLQPSVALFGVRRFGRADYSFVPGEPLPDYLVQMDVSEQGKRRSERFEINHHSYRLRQSRCFQESEGALHCVSCHDPHRKTPAEDRAAHYRSRCLKCHEPGDYETVHETAAVAEGTGDCVSCHMPRRRTQDVVRAVMTDHLVRRGPGGSELLALLAETEPALTAVEFLEADRAPTGPERELYRAAAVIRATSGAHAQAVDHLEGMLAVAAPDSVDPYLDLARGQLKQRRYAAAEGTVAGILEREPGHRLAKEWFGLSLLAQDKVDEAVENLSESLEEDPGSPEVHYNLGLAFIRKDRYEEARLQFEQAIAARPNMAPAWYYLGRANASLNQIDEAIRGYRRVLEIEPSHTRAYVEIGRQLLKKGNREEALRYYQQGLKVASRIAPIAQALDEAR